MTIPKIDIQSRARIAALVAAAGVTALAACSRGESAEAAAGTAPAVAVSAQNVTLVLSDTLSTGPALSGTLTPEREAQVRAEAAGSVLRIDVEPGQQVSDGASLARIEDDAVSDAVLSARSALAAAESNHEIATREVERAGTLLAAGAIAERDAESARRQLDAARSQLAGARAQLAAAEKQLSGTRVRAPFAGVVSERRVSVGDVVSPGAPLFTVVDPRSMRYEASVPAERLGEVRVGAPVHFAVSGYPGRTFVGRVTRVNPVADPSTRQVRLIVSVPNEGGRLVGGLYAEGRVDADRRVALVAPMAAVDQRGVTPAVYRVRNGVVEQVPVEVLLRDEATERVALAGALAAGDTLLVGAAQGITPGTPVRVSQPGSAPGDTARRAAPAASPPLARR